MREDASWAAMTLTEPAVTRLDIVHMWHGRDTYHRHGYVNMPNGVTMKIPYAYVCKHLSRSCTNLIVNCKSIVKRHGLSFQIRQEPYPYYSGSGRKIDLSQSQVVLICTGNRENTKKDPDGKDWLAN